MTRRLVALDLAPGTEFVVELQRIWDEGDAVLPLDQRLPHEAKLRLLAAMGPAAIVPAPENRRSVRFFRDRFFRARFFRARRSMVLWLVRFRSAKVTHS
jgi:hypothetical protein